MPFVFPRDKLTSHTFCRSTTGNVASGRLSRTSVRAMYTALSMSTVPGGIVRDTGSFHTRCSSRLHFLQCSGLLHIHLPSTKCSLLSHPLQCVSERKSATVFPSRTPILSSRLRFSEPRCESV